MNNIYVISTGRNAGDFVVNCIESVKAQTLLPTEHMIIDDMSDDNTRDILMNYLGSGEYSCLNIRFSSVRKYRLLNLYEYITTKDPEDIVCIVDSDDWLAHDDVLKVVKSKFESDEKLEYVYSRYSLSTGEEGGSSRIYDGWEPYSGRWITSHMCSIRVKALQRIPVSNFLDWNNQWFKIATDHAMILPIAHKLKQLHGDYSAIGFIDEPLYVHTFHGNPSKPRAGTPEADERAKMAVRCSTYIKQRGYIDD
jgi:glycosyltransferase involved in cell wall biosynthesis